MTDAYIYGFHPIAKMLQHTPESCQELICTESKNPRLISLIARAKELKLSVRVESKKDLSEIVGSEKHQGCVMRYIASTSSVTSVEQCLAEMNDRSLQLTGVTS